MADKLNVVISSAATSGIIHNAFSVENKIRFELFKFLILCTENYVYGTIVRYKFIHILGQAFQIKIIYG